MFPNLYREIKEMVPKLALKTPMARAIIRKAGLQVGKTAAAQRMGLLLAANGGSQQAISADTPIRFDAALSTEGDFVFTPGQDYFIAVDGGLARVHATISMAPPSVETLMGLAVVTETGERAVIESRHHLPTTFGVQPDRVVLSGAQSVPMGAGERASLKVFVEMGAAGNVLQNGEATRLYAEII